MPNPILGKACLDDCKELFNAIWHNNSNAITDKYKSVKCLPFINDVNDCFANDSFIKQYNIINNTNVSMNDINAYINSLPVLTLDLPTCPICNSPWLPEDTTRKLVSNCHINNHDSRTLWCKSNEHSIWYYQYPNNVYEIILEYIRINDYIYQITVSHKENINKTIISVLDEPSIDDMDSYTVIKTLDFSIPLDKLNDNLEKYILLM